MDKELINLYDKNDDPAMWELREIKIKMSKEKLTAEKINASAQKAWDEFYEYKKSKSMPMVSDKSANYKRKKS